MSAKLAELKNTVVENMTAEIVRASEYCWKYKYVKINPKLYTKWAHYRLQLLQYRKWVDGMDCPEFAKMLTHNVNEIQVVVFGN